MSYYSAAAADDDEDVVRRILVRGRASPRTGTCTNGRVQAEKLKVAEEICGMECGK